MCVFCIVYREKDKVIMENEHAFAMYDGFPVNKGHTLIITNRHVSSFFDLSTEERLSINLLIEDMKTVLDNTYHPDGYNIGVNIGEAAGQTIDHCHIHLIPRYQGDVSHPRGGVRGVIPSKQSY
ncbi:MAG: HIT family protein [Acholeplasmataceae bacterium]|nr:HIT family protein [Acholeplasmataceae bacterium]